MSLILSLCFGVGLAAEVVWLEEAPDPAARDRVAEWAGATGPALSPGDLRVAASAWGPEDAQAYEVLEGTLREVRPFERRLDGERVIMRDLEEPLSAITLVRGAEDRDRLFAALAYQGFAVHRFFPDDLDEDPRAEPFRVVWDETALVRPWLDAVALDPDREIGPYEIAEAPQRIAFAETRRQALGALPGELRFDGEVPEGARVMIGGRETAPTSAGGYRVVPGRQLVHLEADHGVLARYDVRVGPGDRAVLEAPLSDGAWEAWLDQVRVGVDDPPPAAVAEAVEALGGEVWVVWPTPPGEVAGVVVGPEGLAALDLPRLRPTREREAGVTAGVSVTGGWMYSGDFVVQDPEAPHERSTVNAAALGVELDLSWEIAGFGLATGLWTQATLGPHHVARYGEAQTRLRPAPWIGAGLPWVQATVGWLFPYHPTLGLRGVLPLPADLELRANGLLGLPTERARADGSVYRSEPIYGLVIGVGWRLPL